MKKFRILVSLILSTMLVLQAPLVAFADDATTTPTTTTDQTAAPTDQTTTPAADTTTTAPADSTAPATDTTPAPAPEKQLPAKPGYAFNDSQQKWQATDQDSFTWDDSLNRWVSPLYWFDPQVAWYHVITASPAASSTSSPSGSGNAGPSAASANDPSNSNTGPGSTNTSALNNSNALNYDAATIASITNNLTSAALSGAANVELNTNGGSATTGAALVVANYLNLLNSMWSWANGGISSFIYNIFGDHTGDINLTVPGITGGGGTLGSLPTCGGTDANSNTGPLSVNTATSTCNNTLNGNNRVNGAITNNIDLNAQSGDANVQNNTTGGSATSGDATAALNIVNMINSSIGAGQMFFGMINIFGNLNGDILFPGLSLDNAIAGSANSTVGNSNTGAGSTNNAGATNNNTANLNNNVSGAFNNNVDATANSGNANVLNNTNGGSATTGDAATNTNTFNLFDTSIFGDNAVLVLINDMGHWVGRIMNLPGGSSGGALLTSNATVTNNNTGAGSTNNASSNNNNTANLNNNVDGTITNNVKANATSGDANVENNTNGGNATSGAAKVATNIANIFGSHLSFGHVFGILIVNVFGSWTGSVGVDTDAGNAPGGSGPVNATATPTTPAAVLAQLNAGSNGSTAGSGGSGASGNSNFTATNVDLKTAAAQKSFTEAAAKANSKWPTLIVFFAIASMMLAAGLSTLERRLGSKA